MSGLFSKDKGEEVTIGIEGMSCQHCVGKVEKGLSEIEGVLAAKVNLEQKEATVRFDPDKVTIDDIKQKIHDVGYTIP